MSTELSRRTVLRATAGGIAAGLTLGRATRSRIGHNGPQRRR